MIQYPSASLLVRPGLGLFDTGGVKSAARISRSSIDIQVLLCCAGETPAIDDEASILCQDKKVKRLGALFALIGLLGEHGCCAWRSPCRPDLHCFVVTSRGYTCAVR